MKPINTRTYTCLCFSFLIAISLNSLGQQNPKTKTSSIEEPRYQEVTDVDITQVKDIDASEISVLGVHLGTSIQKTKQKIARKKGIFFRQDKFNNSRLYLYEYNQGNKKNDPLGYFKWNDKNSGLDEIIIYEDFKKYMKGKSKKLVTREALSYYEEGVGKNFLGYPLKKEKILNIPSQNLKHTAYYYKGKSYQVIKQVNGENVKYAFGIFDTDTEVSKKSEAK